MINPLKNSTKQIKNKKAIKSKNSLLNTYRSFKDPINYQQRSFSKEINNSRQIIENLRAQTSLSSFYWIR
jgi:hypothetical protein